MPSLHKHRFRLICARYIYIYCIYMHPKTFRTSQEVGAYSTFAASSTIAVQNNYEWRYSSTNNKILHTHQHTSTQLNVTNPCTFHWHSTLAISLSHFYWCLNSFLHRVQLDQLAIFSVRAAPYGPLFSTGGGRCPMRQRLLLWIFVGHYFPFIER